MHSARLELVLYFSLKKKKDLCCPHFVETFSAGVSKLRESG